MGSNDNRMAEAQREVPDDESLARGLSSVLEPESDDGIVLLEREVHRRMSTFPLEIVRCRLSRGHIVEVVCKYSDDQDFSDSRYRGGVAYEADVYRDILDGCELPVPGFRGTYRDATTGRTWLVLDYLNGAEKSGETENGLSYAAEWLGRFHAINEGRGTSQFALRIYDAEYFASWAIRAMDYARAHADEWPWLERMGMAYVERIPELFRRPLTIIHGEYYYKNVLVADGVAYPIDWETAAAGPDVVDIAALTECWREGVVSECLERYCASRWPDGAPADFSDSLDVARAYWLFRWLGDVEHKTFKRLQKRLPQLTEMAHRWGIIDEQAP
jgi:aminoglycoside phosphotransferase (APT) family kinase protein